jgi:hypothetical protein
MNPLLRPLLRHALAPLALAAATLVWAQPAPPMPPAVIAAAARNPVVVAGDAWVVTKTTPLESLKIEAGGAVVAPAGHSLTMTVDGVETTLKPGKYRGRIVLTVTVLHPVKFSAIQTHHFRQALYLDRHGVVAAKSVTAAAGPFQIKGQELSGARIRSAGENFNGLLVADGRWNVKDLQLDFDGNGGNDFAGYGAGVMSDGKGTTLVLENAKVTTRGAVRTAVIGHNGSNLVVKRSKIASFGGELPADYVSNVTPGEMKDAPWMLGIRGNVRATNVLGNDTTCTYIDSDLSADSWGVLSVDASQNIELTALNSRLEVTGPSGYGSYAIGNSTNNFYGSTVNVPTHGLIMTGGHAVFAASTAAHVAALNQRLKLGLTAAEMAGLPAQQTVIRSKRYGVMIWGDGGTVKVGDATRFETGEAVFLNKAADARIEVDGSQGATLHSGNGVLLQMMDNDDPGPVMADGLMANTGVWRDPITPATKLAGFDLGATHATDTVVSFKQIKLQGDFFNAVRQRTIGGGFGSEGPRKEAAKVSGANLVLTLEQSELTGVVTAATARHTKDPITAADYESLGRVVNTPAPAVNNGVVLTLERSRWTVTGPSHLTRLTVGTDSVINAPSGQAVTMTVDGVATPIRPGSYRGQIVLQPAAL